MVRAAKSKPVDVVEPVVSSTPAVEVVSTLASAVSVVASKKTKKTKTVVEPVVDTTSVANTNVAAVDVPVVEQKDITLENFELIDDKLVVDDDSSMAVKMNIFGTKLQQLTSLLTSVKNDYKLLEKNLSKELKNAKKSQRKKKATGNRAPSGFVKPTKITDELAVFLGKPLGTEMARTDVSKEINGYIRSNNLQDKANGRKIIADQKLSALLKLGADDELTYFNLQKYMKHHFIKTEAVPPIVV